MISVVIPHMLYVTGIDHILKKCVKSLKGADEIIVVANEGIGFGASVNLGLELVNYDFIIISNNDIFLESGDIQDLCDPRAVTVPRINPQPKDNNPRPFYCMPYSLYKYFYNKYGYWYDERFEMGYWEDDDLIKRLEESEIPINYIETVSAYHLNGGGTTMKTVGEQKYYDENKERFMLKWNHEDNLQ